MHVQYPYVVFASYGCVYVLDEESHITIAELRFSPQHSCHIFVDTTRFLVLVGSTLYFCERGFDRGPVGVSRSYDLSDEVLFMSAVNEHVCFDGFDNNRVCCFVNYNLAIFRIY